MKVFSRMRVSTRMLLLVALTLVGLLVLCFIALAQLRASMLEDRKQSTKNIVEVGIGILAHHHQLAQEGKLSDDAAKTAAKESLRGLRYGSNDYLYIYLTNGINFMHPIRKDFEGQDKRDLKDSSGKLLIQEILAAGQKPEGGFVDFWFPRPGKDVPEPKIGYSATFAPWNMVVGTGIYIDDIDREFKKSAFILGGISLILLAALSVSGWLVSASVLRHLGGEPAAAVAIMQKVADGDLTAGVGSPPDGSLLHALGSMVTSLRELVREINASARLLANNAGHINNASAEVASAADRQADATSSMAAAIEQLTVSSTHISDSARETEGDSLQAMQQANEGSALVTQATLAIQRIAATVTDASGRIHALEERAGQISTIASVIKDIAGQTNLLALNAAIEAARAGEQGRGFAVVADEVRKLAERTSSATTEIEQMISGIQGDTSGAVEAMNEALPEVEQGVQLAKLATQSLKTIESGANRTLARVREIADATHEQGSASTSIAQRVEQVAQMVEETTTTIRGTSDMAKQLEDVAQKLSMQIARFKV